MLCSALNFTGEGNSQLDSMKHLAPLQIKKKKASANCEQSRIIFFSNSLFFFWKRDLLNSTMCGQRPTLFPSLD